MAEEQIRKPYAHPTSFEEVNGVIHMPKVNGEVLRQMKDLPVQANDIFISTYPKSGTTWMSEIVLQMHHNGNIDDKPLGEKVLFMEELISIGQIKAVDLKHTYLTQPSPRIFKLHLTYEQTPTTRCHGNGAKYIYVARNPKDTAVSFYHHYRGFTLYEFSSDRTWDEFFEMFINNKVHYGEWFDHVLSWWAHKDDDDVLFVKYEDMKKDVFGTVQSLAKFLCKNMNKETIELIVNQTSFSAMLDGKDRYYDGMKDYRNPNTSLFMRKGQIGDWKNYFTEDQNKRFDALYDEKMSGSGLQFDFE